MDLHRRTESTVASRTYLNLTAIPQDQDQGPLTAQRSHRAGGWSTDRTSIPP